eukprot:TRINITY_DN7281_c0_g1_i1.p1 TRINITY_DN7281_c0_g1~~TRINITY_DN7281_c0_g1_i1.p1  ORF type:complete len:881 (-),score=238.83 TRINITY_DN7281_c0_g1_i1:139-2781(-)
MKRAFLILVLALVLVAGASVSARPMIQVDDLPCDTPACQVIDGILKALGIEQTVDTCVGDLTTGFEAFENASIAFQNGKDDEGIALVAQGLNEVAQSVSDCKVPDVVNWIEEMATKLFHVNVQWLNKVVVVVVDGSNIYKDLYNIANDVAQKNYNQAGNDIGSLVSDLKTATGCTKGVCDAIIGMLRVVGVVVEDLGDCKDDLEAAYDKFSSAVSNFDNKDYQDAVSDLAAGLGDLAQSTSSCQLTKLASLIEDEIQSFGGAEVKWLENSVQIIVNGADIYEDMYHAVTDWKAGNYPAFGADVADLLMKLESSKCTSDACVVAEGILEVLQIVARDMGQCKTDLETALSDFEQAAQDFNNRDYQTAVAEFASALNELAVAFSDCDFVGLSDIIVMEAKKLAGADIQKVSDDVKIIVEGADLYHDIYNCVQDILKKDYRSLGTDLGSLIADIEAVGCTSKACQFVDNLLKGLKILVGDLGTCKSGLENAFLDIEASIEAFDDQDYKGFLSNFSSGLDLLAEGVQTCQLPALATLLQAEARVLGLGEIKYLDKTVQIIVNGADIYNDVFSAVKDFKNDNYAAFGRDIADLLTHLQTLSCSSPICVIIDGILEALQYVSQDFGACKGDMDDAYSQLENAISYFESEQYEECLSALGDALEGLAEAISSCDVQDLGKVLQDLATQLHMGNVKIIGEAVRILVGGADLYEQLYQSVEDFKGKDYRQFGIDFGKFLLQVAKMRSKYGCASPFCLILEGVIEVLQVETSLAECKSDIESSWGDFENCVSEFKGGHVKTALHDLAEGLHEFAEGVDDCKVAQVAEIIEKLAEKLGLGEFYWLEEAVKIIIDGADIYDDVYNSVEAWESRDFVVFGFDLAKLVIKLIDL